MVEAKLTSKGQLTIPKLIRERLGIRPGDEVEFVEETDGYLMKKRVGISPFDKYLGYLKGKVGEDPDQIIETLRGR